MSTESENNTNLAAEDLEKGNFYVFEALDGVGKTSTAEAFADRINAKYLETHSEAFEEFKPFVKEEGQSLETKLLFYLGSNSARSDQIEKELEQGNDVVMDRYYHSTLAFHHAKSGEDPLPYLDLVDSFDIIEPDTAFYLHVDEEERLRRINEREESGHSFEKDSEFMGKVDEAYRQIAYARDMPVIEAVGGVENVVDQAEAYHGKNQELQFMQQTLAPKPVEGETL